MDSATDFAAARRHAEQSALAVAQTIHQLGVSDVESKSTRAYDVVTKTDIAVEAQLVEALTKFDSGISIRGEELGGDRSASTTWLIDPIDGTGHFTRGMPWATTMIALIYNNEVVVSVMNNFATGELYSAAKNHGATRNGRPIHVVDRPVPGVYVLYDFDLTKPGHPELLSSLEAQFPTLNYWACGHSYASIAQGSFDGRIVKRRGEDSSDWDHAPGALLVQEAGGIVANIGTSTYDYRNHDFIAATPSLFAYLTDGHMPLFSPG